MTRRFLLLGFALLCVSGLGWSQQKGQWVHEQYGLNAGVVPDPGFTYQNLAINYSAGQLRARYLHVLRPGWRVDVSKVEVLQDHLPLL